MVTLLGCSRSADVNSKQAERFWQFQEKHKHLLTWTVLSFPPFAHLCMHMCPNACIFFMALTCLPSGHRESLLFIRWCNESICPLVPLSSFLSPCTSVPRICSEQRGPLRDRRHWEELVFYVNTHLSHSPWHG